MCDNTVREHVYERRVSRVFRDGIRVVVVITIIIAAPHCIVPIDCAPQTGDNARLRLRQRPTDSQTDKCELLLLFCIMPLQFVSERQSSNIARVNPFSSRHYVSSATHIGL